MDVKNPKCVDTYRIIGYIDTEYHGIFHNIVDIIEICRVTQLLKKKTRSPLP
jgi:hypothetical protein